MIGSNIPKLTLLDDRLLCVSLKDGNSPMANGDQAIKPTPAMKNQKKKKIINLDFTRVEFFLLTNFVVQFGHVNLDLFPAKHVIFRLFQDGRGAVQLSARRVHFRDVDRRPPGRSPVHYQTLRHEKVHGPDHFYGPTQVDIYVPCYIFGKII